MSGYIETALYPFFPVDRPAHEGKTRSEAHIYLCLGSGEAQSISLLTLSESRGGVKFKPVRCDVGGTGIAFVNRLRGVYLAMARCER